MVLERDGKVVTEGTFDAKALRDVLSLEAAAPGSSGAHTWTVRAEPAVPGLGFSLTLSAYVPWKAEKGQGLELAVKASGGGEGGPAGGGDDAGGHPGGHGAQAALRAARGGRRWTRRAWSASKAEGKVTSYEVEDGALTLSLPPRGPGELFQASFRVVPTLAGTLQGGASSLFPDGAAGPRLVRAPIHLDGALRD